MVEIEYNLMLAERMGRKRKSVDIGAPEIHLSQLEKLLGLTDDDVGLLIINGKSGPARQFHPRRRLRAALSRHRGRLVQEKSSFNDA